MYNLLLFFGFMVSAGVSGNFRSFEKLKVMVYKISGNDTEFFVLFKLRKCKNWNFLIHSWDVLLLC